MDINSEVWIEEQIIPDTKELEKKIPAEIGFSYCNKLFCIERQLKELSAEERKASREVLETSVWNSF